MPSGGHCCAPDTSDQRVEVKQQLVSCQLRRRKNFIKTGVAQKWKGFLVTWLVSSFHRVFKKVGKGSILYRCYTGVSCKDEDTRGAGMSLCDTSQC